MASSYSSAAARNSRRPGAGNGGSSSTTSRPVHARQHSANTAGDVFAMLGKPTSKERDDRERESSRARQDSKESDRMAENTPSSPSGSTNSLSTPSSSFDGGRDAVRLAKPPSPARFKKLYTKPRLLGLWSKDRSLEVSLAHIFSSMEAPDKYTTGEENAPLQRYYQAGHGRRVTSGEHPSGTGALGRLPTGERVSPTAYTNPHSASARRGERYGQIGIQGGVLSGVGNTGQPRHASNRDEEDPEFERAPLGRGQTRTVSHGVAVAAKDEKEKGPQAGGPAWTSNRWRHLQTEDESQSGSTSGTSSRENELEDPIKAPESQSSAWVPPAEDKIRAERPKLLQDALDSMTTATSQDQTIQQQSAGSLTGMAAFGSQRHAALKGTPSKNPLWTDDLLSPALSSGSRASGGPSFPSEPHPIAHAVALAPTPSASNVTNTLSRLSLNKEALLGNNVTRRPSETMTPTRLQASEGLDILARRSPVQELSMAQLQQQGFLQHQQQQQQQYQPYSAVAPSPLPRASNPEAIFWQYKDPSGNIQGPFSAVQMQDWHLQGFFNETLLVRRIEATDFETLGALVIRIGDASKPFLSNPAPRMYGPPGMFGIGQSVSISPVAGRVASPSLWSQGHSHPASAIPQSISQSSSRHASFSGNLGNYPDVFAPSALPQANYSHIHAPQPQLGGASAPLDPWADTLPQSPAISRSTSQQALADSAPAAVSQEMAPIAPIGRGPGSTSVTANAASPVVRAPGPPKSMTVSSNKEPSSTKPEGSLASEVPASDKEKASKDVQAAKADSKTLVSTSSDSSSSVGTLGAPAKLSTTTTSSQTSAPQSSKPLPSGQADALRRAAVTQQPSASGSPDDKAKWARSSASGKVQVSAQEAFDKQKAAGQAAAAQTSEYPFPVSSAAEGAASSPTAAKTAPWVKTPADTTSINSAATSGKATLSLKEIQAKEAQQAIARKAAEKRALAAQLAAEEAALAEKTAREQAESLPSKSTWGTGAAVTSPASSGPASSPWAKANSSPAAPAIVAQQKKKSMKEILEEEESRKKKAAAAASNPVLPGKGYAGSISGLKNGASPAALAGGVWTTVGTTKPGASVPAPAVRAPAAPSPGKPVSLSAAIAPAASVSRPAAQAVSVPSVASSLKSVPNGRSATPVSKSEDTSIPASPDLIKWCKEALKGLEIPIDDFIHMLLSFPLPIDKSTRELISDSVYASSRTLDGRHFADAFADKRQADAKAIKAGKVAPAAPVAPAQKPVSFTDAIKFVPNKPVEPNFKIVTKKQTKGKK